MTIPTITSPPQALAEVVINEAFDTLDHQTVYGRRHAATSGLTWGYYGGRWGGFSVADGTHTLTGSTTNYIVVERATGTPSVSTATTNWNNTSAYARVYQITTSSTAVTAVQDHRAGPNGVHGSAAGGSNAGRHSIWIAAAAMQPQSADGCSILTTIAGAGGQPDVHALLFDATAQEFAQFSIAMPKSWNEGTVTFAPIWRHASTATNFGVVWGLQAVAVSDDDPIAASYGTAQTSTDTGGTTGDLYRGPESSAITIAGTPAAEDVVFFRVFRDPANGSDTLAIDAALLGIVLYITTDAVNDA